MKIIDLYSKLKTASVTGQRGYAVYRDDPELQGLEKLAKNWGMDVESTREWLQSPEAIAKENVALQHLAQAPTIIRQVESVFGRELPGRVILSPSYGEFDGFARYDRGEHTVILGIDFPDADVDYLKAITAHELSHVYRDHAPEVWSHLGKPLKEISRAEYLEAGTAQEHLVSEGLATLFSQMLYPEIPPLVHHYYDESEWRWIESHTDQIHRSLIECLQGDANVWSYYAESRVEKGSPSRIQYYWAAKTLSARLNADPAFALKQLVELHRKPSSDFPEFSGA